jgi:hypothetical protein
VIASEGRMSFQVETCPSAVAQLTVKRLGDMSVPVSAQIRSKRPASSDTHGKGPGMVRASSV